MNCLPSFGPHPCPVYLHLPYMGENSIRLAKQPSLVLKSTFLSLSLRVVYNTNRRLNGIVKDFTPTHDLSNIVYIFKCHWGNDQVGQKSQRFHVRQERHVSKKLKKFIFNDDVKPKGKQSSIHQHLLNNPICTENYLDSRFEIIKNKNINKISVFKFEITSKTLYSKFNTLNLYKYILKLCLKIINGLCIIKIVYRNKKKQVYR